MQLVSDMKRAKKFAKRVYRGRKALFGLRSLLEQRGPLEQQKYRIGVYYADSDVNIYQMRQWYAPLQQLNETHPVLLISRHPAGAQALMNESGLDVAFAQKITALERLVAEQPLEIVLYVNQNQKNFQMMRYGSRWHVFINHGESDKMYMTSNQYKTYDFAFIAGNAARDRLSRALWDYDLDARTFSIGRPQTDHLAGDPPFPQDGKTVVLYAPTWEGDRPAAHYGSVASHGEKLVKRLLETGRHRVVYRPHPRSGVLNDEFGAANKRIIEALAEANRQDSSAQHVFDQSASLGWQLSVPDVAICDISAMVYDRLATGKPLLVTRPVSPDADIDTDGYLGVCEWLTSDDCERIAETLDRVINDSDAKARNATWSSHYFGDTTQGAPTRRFHDAIELLLAKAADEKRARI